MRKDAVAKIVLQSLEWLHQRNRTQSFEAFTAELAAEVRVSRAGVGSVLRAMDSKGWLTVYRGKRKNSKEYVYHTPAGKKEYLRRLG